MFLAILNYITDSTRTAATSVVGAFVGQATISGKLNIANIALQHAAWTVAIMAGLLTIANLFFPLRSFYERKKLRRHQKYSRR